jgi:hypothetical protein
MSNFTFVKLIIHFVLLFCIVNQASANESKANRIYVVQIAASKTPLNKHELSLKHNISQPIREVKSGLWNRYFVGKFENRENALALASELNENTKLKNVFVKLEDDFSISENQLNVADTSSIPHDSKETLTQPDSIEKISEIYDNLPSNYTDFASDWLSSNSSENFILRLFLNDDEISVLQRKLIGFGKDNIPQPFRGLYALTIEKSFEYPVVLFFLCLILIFILNIIGVFLLLNYTIKRKRRKERFLRIFGKMYEEVLIAYMFGSIDWPTTCVKLKRKKKRENRKVLISILLNFKENFRGDLEKLVPDIFIKLGLQNDSLQLANSSRIFRKTQGIIELTHLYPDGAKSIVSNLINAKNDYVRSEAQIAFIRLNPDEPFKFFENLIKPFTRWTQISAFNLIRIYQLPVPSFADHLNRRHVNIRNFSLRMIVYFQQLENIPGIIRMVESELEQTRYLSYVAINNLRIYEGKELIKSKYWNETGKNKLEIIKAFKNIGIDDDFDFLEKIILSEPVALKTEACRSLYFMNQNGKEKLDKMKNNSVQEIGQLIAHVTDPRN